MKLAYIDSSVLLRFVLAEPETLKEFKQIEYAVSSELIRVECLRTMERYKSAAALEENDLIKALDLIHSLLANIEQIGISRPVLHRAAQPFPTHIGTLGAIHLSTCLLYQERLGNDMPLCSHDEALKRAARTMGIEVFG